MKLLEWFKWTCEQWYEGGTNKPCRKARAVIYCRLVKRYGFKVVHHIHKIKAILDKEEAGVKERKRVERDIKAGRKGIYIY